MRGESVYGAVGNGSFSETVTTPTQVSSTLNFNALVSTNGTNCGLTTGGLAYRWGATQCGHLGLQRLSTPCIAAPTKLSR